MLLRQQSGGLLTVADGLNENGFGAQEGERSKAGKTLGMKQSEDDGKAKTVAAKPGSRKVGVAAGLIFQLLKKERRSIESAVLA